MIIVVTDQLLDVYFDEDVNNPETLSSYTVDNSWPRLQILMAAMLIGTFS